MDVKENSTLFVRSLPFNTTNKTLESVFSEIGPIKKCFVITDKGSDKCKGYGYVQYALKEDACKAKEDITKVGDRQVIIEFSGRKPSLKERKKKTKLLAEANGEDDQPIQQMASKKPSSTTEKKKPEKKFKLIIRNLSFKANVEDIEKAFEKFGKPKEVTIPKHEDGKKKGFGFVLFDTSVAAIKAMKLNGTKIKGRPVVLDWAVSKDRFQKIGTENTAEKAKATLTKPDKQQEESDAAILNDSGSDSEESMIVELDDEGADDKIELDSDRADDDSDDEEFLKVQQMSSTGSHVTSLQTNMKVTKNSRPNTKSSSANYMDDSESESDSEEDKSSDESDSEEDHDEEEDEEEEEENSDDEQSQCHTEPSESIKDKKPRASDVEQGRTLFIRNLPYECEEEDLFEEFSKVGPLVYARVVFDPKTGHSRGTGFVQFKKKDAADKCVATAAKQELKISGRSLLVTLALNKTSADQLRKDKKDPKDNADKSGRNLWLAREGMIRTGSQLAQGLSKADLDKRQKLEASKREKLKNPNMFVSTTRLSIHNLPTSVNDVQLRTLIVKQLKDKTARITECRIMRSLDRVNSEGVGKSRGYAFINFTTHDHALRTLKCLNNNAEVFGENRRPIAEFSVENRMALLAKQKRQERAKLKESVMKSTVNKKGTYTRVQKSKKVKKAADDPTVAVPPENMQKGMKALPSHWGPKLRHKAKAQPPKVKKRKQQPIHQTEPQVKMPKQRRKSSDKPDSFDSLVNKYRQSMSQTEAPKKKGKGKWFNA